MPAQMSGGGEKTNDEQGCESDDGERAVNDVE